MREFTLKWRIGLGVLLIILLVGGAFLGEEMTKVRGSQNGKLVPVVQNTKIVAYMDSGVIQQLSIQERALRKNRSPNNPNQVSLDFVLGSAGIADYHKVRIYGVGDEEGSSFSKAEIAQMTLSPNLNSTISLLDKGEGSIIRIKEVRKILIED